VDLSRRKLFTGLGLLIAAPVIVRAASLMPVNAAMAFEPYDCPITGVWIKNYAAHKSNLLLHDCTIIPRDGVPLVMRHIEGLNGNSNQLDAILDRALEAFA
jgi:hypothetical protein